MTYAETLGFDVAWMPDQTFHRDPYVMLASIAQHTTHMTVGLAVTNPFTRHPAITARSIATVADFAPGRLILGIGAGNMREVVGPLGLSGGRVADRCAEMVEIVRPLLRGERVTFEGQYFAARDVGLAFDVNGDVPIYVAGRGPEMLQLAGRVADGVIIGGLATRLGWSHAISMIQDGARKAGQDRKTIPLVGWVGCEIVDSPVDLDTRIQRRKPQIAHLIGGAPTAAMLAVGVPEEVVHLVTKTYRSQGPETAARYVTDDCVHLFSIIGSPEDCSARIGELVDIGASMFTMLLPQRSTVDHHRARLEEFAETVFPQFDHGLAQ